MIGHEQRARLVMDLVEGFLHEKLLDYTKETCIHFLITQFQNLERDILEREANVPREHSDRPMTADDLKLLSELRDARPAILKEVKEDLDELTKKWMGEKK